MCSCIEIELATTGTTHTHKYIHNKQVGYEQISLYDVSTLLIAYGGGCVLAIVSCNVEMLRRRLFGRRRQPTRQISTRQNTSILRKARIVLQDVDGQEDVHFVYLLSGGIDVRKLQRDFDRVIRQNYVT
jgi:hypothetical protein